MNDQLKRHVDDILAHMESAGIPANRTDEQEQQEPTRLIDIHIYEMTDEQEEQPTIESTLEDAPDQPKARRRFPLVGLVLLCLVLVCAFGVFYLQPLFAPSATVTIVPATKQISLESTISVVTDTAHSNKQEVPGRVLPTITMSQQQTSATTGTVHQEAKAAHGTLTFYNALTTAQTIPAGELLTGADGIQIVTDQMAVIPAALPPTEGQGTILAHAIQPGPGGNIKAGDVSGKCCRDNVFVINGTFTGGQEARTYQTVTQADIDTLAAPLTTSIEQSVQAALQKQVKSDETLITPLTCQATVKPDHQPGDAATQVSVTVDDTCQGMTYTSQALRDLANTLVTEQAAKQLGASYTSGTLQTSVTHVTFKDGRATLLVHSESIWGYQFTQAEQQQIKARIAGKALIQAKDMVLHRAGVQSVSFSLTNGASTLPTVSDHIYLLFLITSY